LLGSLDDGDSAAWSCWSNNRIGGWSVHGRQMAHMTQFTSASRPILMPVNQSERRGGHEEGRNPKTLDAPTRPPNTRLLILLPQFVQRPRVFSDFADSAGRSY